MVSVYTAQSVTDAHLIKGLLESEGISAFVYGGDLQGGIGELPVMGTYYRQGPGELRRAGLRRHCRL